MTEPPKEETLERRIARLEAIVRELESGRLELQEAFDLFEEGVGHLKEADALLSRTEMRIERLIAGTGDTVIVQPLADADE
jgi:exodeoxyribonuclease VII small subunit